MKNQNFIQINDSPLKRTLLAFLEEITAIYEEIDEGRLTDDLVIRVDNDKDGVRCSIEFRVEYTYEPKPDGALTPLTALVDLAQRCEDGLEAYIYQGKKYPGVAISLEPLWGGLGTEDNKRFKELLKEFIAQNN